MVNAPIPNLLSCPAPAKVNLYLHITGRREDGYHLIDSLAMFADIADLLELTTDPSRGNNRAVLHNTGPFTSVLNQLPPQDNLIIRALHGMAAIAGHSSDNLVIRLEKNLPLGGGIGGGSADAGAIIRLLCQYWSLDPGSDAVMALAARLGADVMACIGSRPVVMRGIGEVLTPVASVPDLPVVLVHPGIAQPTPVVFRTRTELSGDAYDPSVALPDTGFASVQALAQWLTTDTSNGLTRATEKLTPIVGEVLAALRQQDHALLTRMSGSGSTCFGLFADQAAAHAAASDLRRQNPGWWIMAGTLRGTG